jgi:hypothetical protein
MIFKIKVFCPIHNKELDFYGHPVVKDGAAYMVPNGCDEYNGSPECEKCFENSIEPLKTAVCNSQFPGQANL